MSTRRRILRGTARAVGVLLALAAGAALVAAAAIPAWPDLRAAPESVLVAPAASLQQRVCPGPVLALGDDAQAATATTSIGSTTITTGAFPVDAVIEEVPIDAPDNPDSLDDGTPVSLEASPDAVDVGMLAGAQAQEVDAETHSGLAVAACREPLDDAWLVGGSTALGRTTLVLLANPSSVSATVDLRIYGEDGPVDAPGALGLVVPAGTQRVLPLAGLAPDLASPVVHVASTGGRIAATLEQTAIDGLVPVGVELIGAAAPPTDRLRIAGFTVPEDVVVGTVPDASADHADHADGDGFPALRLFAPGDAPVAASVAISPEGVGSSTTLDVTLEPKQVAEIPLGDLGAGDYAVDVLADGPVVAAARSAIAPTEDGEPGDLAWFPASSPLIGDLVVAVPDAPLPTLHLSSAGVEATVSVVVGGSEESVQVAAGTSTSIPLESDEAIVLRGAEGLHATIGFGDGRTIAAMPVEPPGPLDAPIRVYPH